MKNILLIEDDETTRFIMSRLLKKMDQVGHIGYASNGEIGLTYLKEQKTAPDIILLDVNMPVMDGFQFLEEYQSIEKNKKAKVVILMVTTSLLESDLDKAMSNPNVKECIAKPVSEENMNTLFEKHFSSSIERS
ncbi:MAG: response regulator [Flavobacteriales bacterium]|nr:response regulator [Flavobacteriales bacterium]